MSPIWMLVMCPALALADMRVTLTVNEHLENLQLSGSDVKVISDLERKTFELNDTQLKSAIDKYHGKGPHDAYLHSPTPWGTWGEDLYKKYNWAQVSRVMKPHQGKNFDLQSEPKILSSKIFKNHASVPATFDIHMNPIVQSNLTTTWSNSSQGFTVGGGVMYDLVIHLDDLTQFRYRGEFGKNETYYQNNTMKSTMGMSVVLSPGQSVTCVMSAKLKTMKFQVDYAASLTGQTAMSYTNYYKGRYFWAFDIEDIMVANGMSNSLLSTATVKMSFYYSFSLALRDDETKALIAQI